MKDRMGGYKQPIQRVGFPKKGGLGQFADLRGELGEKEGGCF